jgi:phage gp29-like protein
MVMNQMKKTPGLLYAELIGELKKGRGTGQTMTVWDGKTMPQFRNRNNHRFAMKFFGWLIHRKNTKTYYLTYSSNGTIPAVSEATEIVE